ncbi:hypothetical protein [Chamaesiphon sp. VAR_48_metabat_403]|uniref:hypothetical protein n=1 Tax=Chamaesiphon sp. VAR_48_metabat_403 TaxID=2964700 RepID=UPI00286DBCBF|nr:hypothetical protein [Chamaesiphon sp. VAR_48_metabat_403]
MSKSNLDNLSPLTGLRQRQLCELMGWDYRQVAQTAKQQGMSTHAYVQQQTGWILRSELYYPPADPVRNETMYDPSRA